MTNTYLYFTFAWYRLVTMQKVRLVKATERFIKKINLFTNKSIDELWNIQDHDFENMEEKFNNLKFK